MEKLMTSLIALAGILGITTVIVAFRGYVLSVLWGWFVVPSLNLPALSVLNAIGISVMLSMFIAKANKDDSKTSMKALAWGLYIPAFFLFVGWIVHLFAK